MENPESQKFYKDQIRSSIRAAGGGRRFITSRDQKILNKSVMSLLAMAQVRRQKQDYLSSF